MSEQGDRLGERIEQQVERRKQAEKDRRTILAQSVYLGALGLMFVLPVVGGAYLGHWLDGMMSGYSMRWTLSLIMTGIVVGAVNVYFFIKE